MTLQNHLAAINKVQFKSLVHLVAKKSTQIVHICEKRTKGFELSIK